jgi:hypothetical protein
MSTTRIEKNQQLHRLLGNLLEGHNDTLPRIPDDLVNWLHKNPELNRLALAAIRDILGRDIFYAEHGDGSADRQTEHLTDFL